MWRRKKILRAAVLTAQNFVYSHVGFTALSEKLVGGGISVGLDQKLTQFGGDLFNPSIWLPRCNRFGLDKEVAIFKGHARNLKAA
jgi:hypothetical protein